VASGRALATIASQHEPHLAPATPPPTNSAALPDSLATTSARYLRHLARRPNCLPRKLHSTSNATPAHASSSPDAQAMSLPLTPDSCRLTPATGQPWSTPVPSAGA